MRESETKSKTRTYTTFHQRLVGFEDHELKPTVSPYTTRVLLPFIWRNYNPVKKPLKLQLLQEIQAYPHRNDPLWQMPQSPPIDFCYVRPEHIPSVNALCREFFWPVVVVFASPSLNDRSDRYPVAGTQELADPQWVCPQGISGVFWQGVSVRGACWAFLQHMVQVVWARPASEAGFAVGCTGTVDVLLEYGTLLVAVKLGQDNTLSPVSECLQYPDFSCVVLYRKIVIAFAFMVPDRGYNEAYISFIFTHPEWRGAGIAKFMLYHLIQTCMGKDVLLHVSATNSAMLLYQKFGFKAQELILNFYYKYFPFDSKDSTHAFLMRLTR
ncbi:cysteine-rich protein 2-binding protein [Elysia marginata]|uniref:Cysteine-rich protein 2-binding protein n=1 Tax=Elysia marginata TaxID=1093978 RepID=A0AAV4ING8_9GAST|nr:cysteine-rich protein 2-binding protein [Elysia marginata]